MVEAEDPAPGRKAEAFHYDAGSRRDPFIPLVQGGKVVAPSKPGMLLDTTKPTLRGILWDPNGHSLALINDTEAKVGDTIAGGYKIAEIRQDAVVLTGGAEPVVLQISFDAPPKAPGGSKKEGESP